MKRKESNSAVYRIKCRSKIKNKKHTSVGKDSFLDAVVILIEGAAVFCDAKGESTAIRLSSLKNWKSILNNLLLTMFCCLMRPQLKQ